MRDVIEEIKNIAETIEDGQEISYLRPVLYCLIGSMCNKGYLVELNDIFEKFSKKIIDLSQPRNPVGENEIKYLQKLEPLVLELSNVIH